MSREKIKTLILEEEIIKLDIYALLKEYNLQDYYEKQLPIKEQSAQWEKLINIAGEIETYVVEKNNLQKTHWIEKEWGIQNTDKGFELYCQIENEVMEHFNIVTQ
jgi:hypothetical protein|tara:strand:- start:2 stop:316 length:315 start_codon:yes stop_codon:yes gene_type:complete